MEGAEHEPVLIQLGRVTVAYSMLDMALDSLLDLVLGPDGHWEEYWGAKFKLKALAAGLPSIDDPFFEAELKAWTERVEPLAAERNDVIKRCRMFYVGLPHRPGLYAFKPGPSIVRVEPAALADLVRRLDQVANEGWGYHAALKGDFEPDGPFGPREEGGAFG